MVMEIIMSAMPKLLANNYNGNERSILLLFNEIDAKIVRSWRNATKRHDWLDGPLGTPLTGSQFRNCGLVADLLDVGSEVKQADSRPL